MVVLYIHSISCSKLDVSLNEIVDGFPGIEAANMLSKQAFSFPLFIVQVYEALGVGWATSLLGFIFVALVPVPFALSRYGERLRSKSQYSSGD